MRKRVDKESPLPRYVQARRYIEDMIRTMPLVPGDQLPPERELAARFQVSQMTMNRAIQEMVRDGLLYREVGRGTFVVHQDGSATRSGTLALVTLFSPGQLKADPYGGEILRGVQSAAFEAGWDLLLIQEQLDHPHDLRTRLRGRADGFLFMWPPDGALPTLKRMRADGTHILSMGASWPDEDVPAVDTDNIGGAAMAVDHLLGLGHRKIGLVTAPENLPNSRDRHTGFCEALERAGLKCRDEWTVHAESATELTSCEQEEIIRMVRAADAPTAIFAAGYQLAVHTMEALLSEGCRVPDDVSVVGFDDKFSAAFLRPPLTTIAQPLEDLGRRAVERLVGMARGEAPLQTVDRLPVRLVVRRSTAPPKGQSGPGA